jgi:hypothetical protein
MTATEAARHLGKSRQAACNWAKYHGVTFAKNEDGRKAHLHRIHNDPDIRARRTASLRASWQSEDRRKEASDRLKAKGAWPSLTEQQRADYDLLMRANYSTVDALKAIGRADLVQP